MDKLKWLIKELDKSTRRALIENQLNSIPIKHTLFETSNSIRELKHVKGRFYSFDNSITVLRNQNFNTRVYGKLSDIKLNVIKNLLLFDDGGNFINHSDIKVLIDERVCLFYPINQNTVVKYCYICQENLNYNENITNHIDYDIFFNNGLLVEYIKGCTGIKFNNLHIETGLTDNGFIVSQIEREYNVFKENILLFKEGKLIDDVDIIENLSNVFRVDDISTEYQYIIIYSKEQKSIDNVIRYTKHISIVKDILNNVNLAEYINLIQDDFDFRYNPELTEEENKEIILNQILSYSHQNLDKIFTKENSYILKEFRAKDLREKTTNDNIMIIPRIRVNNNINTYVIVFYNGELLNGYSNIKYIANNIMIPIIKSRIRDTDIVEVMYFVDVVNNDIDITLSEGEEFNYNILASNMKDVLFYSNEIDGNHIYDLPEDPERHYIIPYYYKNIGENTASIFFENEFFHNKQIKAVSKRQFKHMRYQIPREHKYQLNYTWYDLSEYLNINPEPNTKKSFDKLFDIDNVNLGGTGILENNDLSYGDIVNNIYTNSTPMFLPDNKYAMHISGYIYLDYDSFYNINLISRNMCKIIIDDVEYCLDLEGQKNINDLSQSNNTHKINLEKGYHKIEIFYYKNEKPSGVSFSLKKEKEYIYTIAKADKLYKKEPAMKILKLYNSMFRYCTNKNHYIIFANNRKLDSKEVILKFCGIDQVYDANYMIFNKGFEEDTILDIIYTPIPVMEVHNEPKINNMRGFISVDKFKLGHTLSPEYCSLFINGKKIPSSQITNVNADTMHIDINPRTIYNLSIVKHNVYQNILSDLFTSSHDAWTEATKMMSENKLERMINSSIYITNEEYDITNLIYKEDVILWNIINNFWIKRFNVIDAEKVFHYEDDRKFLQLSNYDNIPVLYSNYNYNDNNSESDVFLDETTGYTIYSYRCIKDTENTQPSSTIVFGDFKNMRVSKNHSIQTNVWTNFNLLSEHKIRFFIQIYNKYTGRYVEYPMSYLEHHPAHIEDIPKCYWIRVYYNNIKLTSDYDCIRIICKLYHNRERVKFIDKVTLEEYICCSRGIEILPIDAEVITGCELPYTEI